jgi:hypothetical protein
MERRYVSPREAFDAFLVIQDRDDPSAALAEPPETYIAMLDPFLANPEKHREHARLLAGAFAQALVWRGVQAMREGPALFAFGSRALLRVGRRPIRRAQQRFRDRVAELRDELAETVAPARVDLVIRDPTPLSQDRELMRRSARTFGTRCLVAVSASERSGGRIFVPERFRLTLDVTGDERVTFLGDPEPGTLWVEDTSLETTERAMATDDRSSKAGGEVAVPHAPIKLSIERGHTSGREEEQSVTRRRSQQAVRCVASAVGHQASWDLYQTGDWTPVGGLTFSATLEVPQDAQSVTITAIAIVESVGWGPYRTEFTRSFELPNVSPLPEVDAENL